MKKTIVCTLCPNGCEMEAEYTDRYDMAITGNRCDKGSDHAVSECFDPRRTFTGSVAVTGRYRRRIPVRSSRPIPVHMMIPCADYLRDIHLELPVEAGHVVVKNVIGTGADIVTAMSMKKEK